MFTSSVKCLCLAALLVLFVFPLLSLEFGGVSDGSAPGGERAVRSKPPRKFEFRKLVRVVPSEEDSADEEDEEDDTEDEFKFERVHKADGTKPQPPRKAPDVDKYGEDYEEEKEEPKLSVNQDEEPGFLSSLFGKFFGGKTSSPPPPVPPVEKWNGIIDWIQWIRSSFKKPVEEPKPTTSDWMSYLNRWPFNSFFPIGKPEKRISLPGGEDSDSRQNWEAQPMSQDHFESLLHTVPGFVVNASHVSDIECKQQMQIFHRQLRGHKFWTLQMLDATGKITSGMLRGNINQLGDYEMCTHAKTVVKVTPEISMRIRGKYCLAHIETQAKVEGLKVPVHLAHGRGLWRSHLGNPGHFVPRYSIANWGVCIPNACSASVVQEMIETNLRPYNSTGVEFRVEVSENDCHVKTSRRLLRIFKKDGKFGFAVCYLASFWFISAAAYVTENWAKVSRFLNNFARPPKTESKTDEEQTEPLAAEDPADVEEESAEEEPQEKSILKEIFLSFSPKRSLSELVSQERLDIQFPIIHFLKIFATFMLYICLKYIMIGHLPITNRDKLVRTVDQPLSVVFRSPMIYTDILLVISGFLSAYQLSAEMEEKTFIGVIKRIVAKVLRYLPTIYAVIFFQTWILPQLGSGPLWNQLIGQNARLCEQNMWRVLFGAQNAIDFEDTCSPITIQLALELQLYMLGPLLVWLYYTDSDAGFYAYAAFQTMSVAASYSRTSLEHLSTTLFHGMNVSKFYRTANLLYSSPLCRATPYLIGIGAGILQKSTDDNPLEIPPVVYHSGWFAAVCCIAWCFWYPSFGMRSDFIYNSADAADYASWCPLVLGLAVMWIIFMTPKEDSILSAVLTSKPVLFLSRISFPMQLVSFAVVMYTTAGVKEASKYHITDLINGAELGTIVLCSTFLAFLIDVPFQNVRLIIIKKLFTEKPMSEADELEVEKTEDAPAIEANPEGENLSVVSPEPEPSAPDIWDVESEPEEKEHEYVVKFNAHLVNGFGAVVETTISEPSDDSIKDGLGMEPEQNSKESHEEPDEIEVEEEVEEEEEEEIAEEDEVIRRPITAESIAIQQTPPTADESPLRYRRRPRIADDADDEE